MRSASPRWAGTIPLIFAVLALAYALGTAYQYSRHAAETGLFLRQVQEFTQRLDRLAAAVMASETAHRSFLLTNEKRYQDRFQKERDNVWRILTELSRTAHSVPGTEMLPAIQKNLQEKFIFAERSVRQNESGQRAAVLAELAGDEAAFERFRTSKQVAEDAAVSAGLQKRATSDAREVDAAVTSLAAASVSLILVFVTIVRLNRSIKQREAALSSVQKAEIRFQNLAERLEQIREEERLRVSRNIHDELGQSLTAIKIDITMALRRLERGQNVQEPLQRAMKQADQAIQDVRRLAMELRPELLDQLGLVAALRWQLNEFSQRTGLLCEIQADEDIEQSLSPQQRIAWFRIAQEALTNIIRHAKAQTVTIMIHRKDGAVRMTVLDDGQGIRAEQVTDFRSIGIFGMKERARLAGSVATVEAGPNGRGTLVRVETAS